MDKRDAEKMKLKDLLKKMYKRMAEDGDEELPEPKAVASKEEPEEVESDEDAEDTKSAMKKMFRPEKPTSKGVVISIVKTSESKSSKPAFNKNQFKKKK